MYKDSLFSQLAKVYKKNKEGFINRKGEDIIPIIYDKIESGYKKGQPYYWTTLNGKYGYITGEGVFCDPIFDEIIEGFRNDAYFQYDKNILNKIGRYVKVAYQGANYVLGEDGFIYPYKSKTSLLGFGNTSYDVDFDNGIRVGK